MDKPRLAAFVRALNQLGAPYMVSGSVASSIYGEPRFTYDLDVVIFLDRQHIARLAELFPSPEYYCPPPEVIAVEVARDLRGQFNIIHPQSGFKADFYLGGRDPLNRWGLACARREQIEGEPIVLAPPEYIIVRKLEFFREGASEKHLRDIRSMLTVAPELINSADLEQHIAERGLQSAWATVKEGLA